MNRRQQAAKHARRVMHAERRDQRGQEPRPSEQRAARKAALKAERRERRKAATA